MNAQTKLVFALEHVAHLHDLIEDNEYQHYLNDALCTLEFELERQLANELHKKNPKLEYVCIKCFAKFQKDSDLKQHFTLMHEKIMPYHGTPK